MSEDFKLPSLDTVPESTEPSLLSSMSNQQSTNEEFSSLTKDFEDLPKDINQVPEESLPLLESNSSGIASTPMDFLQKEQALNQQSNTESEHVALVLPVPEDEVAKEDKIEAVKDCSGKTQDSKEVSTQPAESNGDNVPTKKEDSNSVLLCRLCAVPCQGAAPVFLFRHPPHHPGVLPKEILEDSDDEIFGDILSMIRATLPIKVSCCDKLPKQVCILCVERLRLSHAFTATVLKAESQLNSLRAHNKAPEPNEFKNPYNSLLPYDCPVCKEAPLLANQYASVHGGRYAWENVVIKDEPVDQMEPSHEELEKSYHEMFGGQKDVETYRTEERITLKPSKPTCLGGRRPRGRPRSRPQKLAPRGRRGRRSTQTTVEKILELSQASPDPEGYGFRICSRENNPASEALTQCLLCDQWLPGVAACLQHSLAEHMDCGAFLCPRCPRDDFPGDFELIQHYQESHCPDLELYEVFQSERCDTSTNSQHNLEHELDCDMTEPSAVKKETKTTSLEPSWHVEPMEYDTLNNSTPNDLYESQDEVSSNLSEIAPRSLTSHSALYEEESNSISTHGSDSNLASEDVLTGHIPEQHGLHDELMGQTSGLADEVCFSSSPCNLGVGDFTSDLRVMEEGSQEHELMEKTNYCGVEDSDVHADNRNIQRSGFKTIQEDCQESQDSLRADELCGFQEAISEKSQEVSLNGSTMHFESDIS